MAPVTASSRRELFRRLAGRPTEEVVRSVEPARALLRREELDVLITEHGLDDRRALVHQLAEVSWRMVERRGAPGRSAWRWGGEVDEVACLGGLDLKALAIPSEPPLLPGVTAVAFPVPAPARRRPGSGPFHFSAITGRLPRGGTPGLAVPELTLPRAWATVAQDEGLGMDEAEAWEDLRRTVAARQGVTPFDAVQGPLAIHRAFGYPDEKLGSMAERCVADGDDGPWRLLLQLSRGGARGETWPAGAERLYVWISDRARTAGDVSDLRAFFE